MTWLAIAAVAAVAVVGATLAAVWLRRRFAVIDVDGPSMEPALHAGDRVLVRRVPLGRVRAGDVVVVEDPMGPPPAARSGAAAYAGRGLAARPWVIKRAVALPGDPLPASVGPVVAAPAGSPVPNGRLVLLGDNRDRSADSRVHGYYRGDQLLGVVIRPMR
jgi:signal peptidase I